MRCPDRFRPALLALLCSCTALALFAAPAPAADLYVSGVIGISSATGDTKFSQDLDNTFSGSDDDTSPVYGGAIGMAFPLSELIPWRLRIPSFDVPVWPGKAAHFEGSEDFRFPGWRTSLEIEAQTGRDYEIITKGASAITPVIANVSSSSFMTNFQLDVPIQAPLHIFFGRLPMLEPVTLFGGVGVGASLNEIEANDTVFGKDSDKGFTFAHQFRAGIGYALTDSIHVSAGWRYYNLGELEVGTGAANGKVTSEVVANEFVSGLTWQFYHLPIFER